MDTPSSLEQHEQRLNSVLKIDAVLTAAGAIGGAVLMGRFGSAGLLHGAWAGMLVTNIMLWGAVSLRGVWAAINGQLRIELVNRQEA
jgi:hypothetical protein